MRTALLAVICVILGLCLGVAATAGFFSVGIRQTLATPAPPPNGVYADLSVVATAPFVNSQIQQAIKSSGLLKQASLVFESPNIVRIIAAVDTTILGQRVTANPTATMRVTVKNNRIILTVEKIDTGNPAIPSSVVSGAVETLRAQAEDQINRLVQRALQGTTLRVNNVRITSNDLTIDLVSQ